MNTATQLYSTEGLSSEKNRRGKLI